MSALERELERRAKHQSVPPHHVDAPGGGIQQHPPRRREIRIATHVSPQPRTPVRAQIDRDNPSTTATRVMRMGVVATGRNSDGGPMVPPSRARRRARPGAPR